MWDSQAGCRRHFVPKMSEWADANLPAAAQICGKRQEGARAGGLALAGDLRNTILINLDRVKAELKQSEQARSDRRRNIGSDLDGLIKNYGEFQPFWPPSPCEKRGVGASSPSASSSIAPSSIVHDRTRAGRGAKIMP